MLQNKTVFTPKGKLTAQICHGSLGVYQTTPPGALAQWESDGMASSIYSGSGTIIEGLINEAVKRNVQYRTVRDAGRTEIAFGTLTVLSLGPDYEATIQEMVHFLPVIE